MAIVELMFEEALLYICVVWASLVLAVHLACAVGVLSNRIRDRFASAGFAARFSVSVVVVAKDEENNLPRLLSSLEAQRYKDFELVLASDRSSDRTLQIMESYRDKHGARVKVLENRALPVDLGPKQYVLDIALSAARGEVLLFTDADCALPEGWVEQLLPYFRDPKVGLVFGQIRLTREKSFLKRFQAFDQPLIHQWNSATAGLGLPGSCFGNNLAARRAAVDEVGGFRGLGYTLTEDAALATAVGKMKWRVRVSTRSDTTIETLPRNSWREFVNQHLRWNSGAFYHQEFGTRFGFRFITLFLIASLLVIPLAFRFPLLFILPACSFISVGLMAFLAGMPYGKDSGPYLLRLVPYTIFFLFFYGFVTALSIFKIKPQWKGKRWRAVEPHHHS